MLFGDSLMAGYGLSDADSLPVVLEENLEAKGYNIEIIDGSVSGSTSSGGLNRADWTLAEPCLLYTSPSPRDLSTSRMPSSA